MNLYLFYRALSKGFALLLTILLISTKISAQSPGQLDLSFNPIDLGHGIGDGANAMVNAVAIQTDGKIIIGGEFTECEGKVRNRIARLDTLGHLDAAFDPGIGANDEVMAVLIQPDGKIIIAGRFTSYNGHLRNRIARLNTDGSLDTTFDPGAGATSSLSSGPGIYAVALQSDGKLVVGGYFTAYNGVVRNNIARLNSDGSLDTSFDVGTGTSNTNNNIAVKTIAIQSDGKIIIGGEFASYNGTARSRIARLATNGALDLSFNPGSGFSNSFIPATVNAIGLQPDGKIIAAGRFTSYNGTACNYLARLNADGTLDISFNPGTLIMGAINTLSLLPNGKITLGGSFTASTSSTSPPYYVNGVTRVNANGTADTSFGIYGQGVDGGTVQAMAQQADGRIIIGGITKYQERIHNRIARLNANGSSDLSFGKGTGPDAAVNTVVTQPDGKILFGGRFTSFNDTLALGIARLTGNGTLDVSFFDSGPGINEAGDQTRVESLILQPDGKIIAVGSFSTYNNSGSSNLTRINSDGSPFSVVPGFGQINNGAVYCAAVQTDNELLIGGTFTSVQNFARGRFARLQVAGNLDTQYGHNPNYLGANDTINSISIQSDGKAIIGGSFTNVFWPGAGRVARLVTNGELDTSFNTGIGANNKVHKVVSLPGDKVLIVGRFTSFNGIPRNRIAILNSNGSLDTSFDPGSGANSTIFSAAVQADGKIVIVGDFTTFNGSPRNRIARLNANGTLDSSFDPGAGANKSIRDLALQPDGRIIIVGDFTSFNSIGRNRLARISGGGPQTGYMSLAPIGFSNLCSGSSINLQITATITFNYGNYFTALLSDANGSFDNPTNIGVLQGTTSGTINAIIPANIPPGSGYRIRIVSSNPASLIADNGADISIDIPPLIVSSIPTICLGSAVMLSATGASSYSWMPGNGLTPQTGNQVVFTPTTAGTNTYTVTGTTNNCSLSSTISITVNSLPAVSVIAAIPAICTGQSAMLSASGAASYSWSTSQTDSVISVTPAATTSYTVTGASSNGCSTTDTVTVTVNSSPIVSLSAASNTICSGLSTTIVAAGATNYSWSTGQSDSLITVSPLATTIYSVTGTSALGCADTATITLTVNQVPTLVASPTIVACDGQIVTLLASAPAGTAYSWSGPNGFTSTNQNPTVTATIGASAYTVTGTLNGCSDSASVVLTGIAVPTVSATANPDSIAPNQLVTLFIPNPDPALTYTWSGPSLNQTTGDTVTANPTTTGTITYTVTASNGTCSATATATVEVDASLLIQIANWNWAYTAGGSGGRFAANSTLGPGFGRQFLTGETGIDIAADAAGNSTTLGRFKSTATFGSTTLTSQGTEDMVLLRTNSSGQIQWVRQAGSATSEEPRAVAMDAAGNSYITGSFSGTASFGTTTLTATGSEDAFLVKYSPAGAVLWARTAGGTGTAIATDVAVDAQGSSTVTGYFYGSISFGNTTLTGTGSVTAFVARYTATGDLQWARQLESSQGCTGYSLAIDAAGNSYLSGTFSGTTSFMSLSSSGSWSRYLCQLDPMGSVAWAKPNGAATSMADGAAVAATDAGYTYLTGTFAGSAAFANGSATLTSHSGSNDVFVLHYSNSGTLLWARKAGGAGDETGANIAVDAEGLCYVTGTYSGYSRFGSHSLSAIGGTDVFVAKYDMGGNCLWARKAGSIADDAAAAVAVDAQGNSYITGSYQLTATFGLGNLLTAEGQQDIFVAKLEHIQVLGTDPAQAGQHRLLVYPNPFSSGFTVSVPAGGSGRAEVLLHDLLGRKLYSRNFDVADGEAIVQVQPEQELPQGVYLLQVRQGETVYTTRLVKQ